MIRLFAFRLPEVSNSFLLVALLLAATGLHASGTLAPASEYTVQSKPYSLACGDLNGDGFQDLAVANNDGLSVSILIGNASGGFGPATNFPIADARGGFPTSIYLHDLNGDNAPDVIVGTGGFGQSSTIQVMLGDGTGAFGMATTFKAGGDPWAVVAGDFTGDGKPDIATANRNSYSVSILPGMGDGTFGVAKEIPVGDFPTTIATGDLNGDGRPDLVTANADSNNISVLLANTSGSFQPAIPYATGAYPSGVAIGDLNGDSRPDIAVADNIDSCVFVLLNTGSGSFSAATPYPTGEGAGAVAIGDLNDDGLPDLAVANYFGATVTVLTGPGNGTFDAAVDYPAERPSSVVIAKFGTDFLPDLAYANEGADSVSVRLYELTDPVRSLRLTPGVLEFGNRKVGTQSPALAVTIENRGTAPVLIDIAGVAGSMRSDFPLMTSECDSTSLPPGQSCQVTVAFQPSAIGKRNAELYLFLVGIEMPLMIPLSGIGIQAKIGKVEVSGPSIVKKGRKASYRVNVTNSGNATASRVVVKTSGKGITAKSPLDKIAPRQTKAANVRFWPKETGKIRVAFKVTSGNAGTKTVYRTIRVQ